MDTNIPEPHLIAFGRYQFLPSKGELMTDDGEQVPLGFRAILVLEALLLAGGRILSQRELVAHVWPGQEVHEANLRVQVAALRKALDDGPALIRNTAGRGYLFTARLCPRAIPEAPSVRPATGACLPRPITQPVGRSEHLAFLTPRLKQERLLTLVGSAGIGKTTLALAVAHQAAAQANAVAHWIALDELPQGRTVADQVASALALYAIRRPAHLAAAIGARPLLLVWDNCEHVADECAELAATLLARCPGVRLLATSRRPLQAAGETVYRVPALDVPAESEQDPDVLGISPAVQLFIQRAQSAQDCFTLDDQALRSIGMICRHLDGIPLAIELAAAYAATYGVGHTASALGNVLLQLRGGRRTAPARQRTLCAALDWSIAMLSDADRQALQVLAARGSCFTPATASQLLGEQSMSEEQIQDSLARLVSHSLLVAEPARNAERYRLLATTRSYLLLRAETGIAA